MSDKWVTVPRKMTKAMRKASGIWQDPWGLALAAAPKPDDDEIVRSETAEEFLERDELARLEREIATKAAQMIVGMNEINDGWAIEDHIGEPVRYLELRGLLERHPDHPEWVRVKEGCVVSDLMADAGDLEWVRRIASGDPTDMLLSCGRAQRLLNSLEAAEAKLREAEKTNDQMQIANDQLGGELDDLREKLRAVGELPRFDIEIDGFQSGIKKTVCGDGMYVDAEELEALLKKNKT